MKIDKIIRQHRTNKGLTQEQVANYLGVSTPAVNKWENSVTYPDITLLPPLSRLLGIDPNTLLSFKEDLTEHEIGHMLNSIVNTAREDGIEAAYNMALESIHEYPSCDKLLLNIAMTVDGLIAMYADKENTEEYYRTTEELYTRLLESEDIHIRCHASNMVISKMIREGKYKSAENLLSTLPDDANFSKRRIQVNLYAAQKDYESACKLAESKLMSEISDVQSSILTLMDIALSENRTEDAETLADIYSNSSKLFNLWEYNIYVAHFQLYSHLQDPQICTELLDKMLAATLNKWQPCSSILYRHMPAKEDNSGFGDIMLKKFIEEIDDFENKEYKFLRDYPAFSELKVKYNINND